MGGNKWFNRCLNYLSVSLYSLALVFNIYIALYTWLISCGYTTLKRLHYKLRYWLVKIRTHANFDDVSSRVTISKNSTPTIYINTQSVQYNFDSGFDLPHKSDPVACSIEFKYDIHTRISLCCTFPPKRIGNAIIYNSCKSWVFIYSRVEFFFLFGSLSNWLIKIQVPVDILPCQTLFTVIEYLRDASADYNWNIVFLVIMYSISLFLSPNSLLTLIQYRGLNTSTSGFQYMTVLVGNIFSEAGLLPETPFFIVKIIFKR